MSTEIRERRRASRRAELADRLLPIIEGLLDGGATYTELSVEQIISSASLSRTTFYRHFDDKSDLLLALSEPALAEIFAAATGPWELPRGATREDLAANIGQHIEAYRPHILLMNAIVELAATDPMVRERFRQGWQQVAEGVAAMIRRGQKDGSIRPDLPPQETAEWIVWMAERGLSQLVPEASPRRLRRLEESLTLITWYTFYDGQSAAASS